MYSFWKLDAEGDLVIDREAALKTAEFRDIAKRTKPCSGDSEGRKKVMNRKEMEYVYYMCDCTIDNPLYEFIDTDKKKLHTLAMERANLPAGWKPDDVVKAAMKLYDLHKSVEFEAVSSTRKQLVSYMKTMDMLNDEFQKQVDNFRQILNNPATGEEDQEKKVANVQKKIQVITGNLSAIQDLVVKLPNLIDSLTSAKNRISAQQIKKDEKIYGGGEKYDYEDPKR